MSVNITMPALSPTMEEGNLAKWLVKEGDTVAAGDVIAEIETDKATMEVEAVDEGTVAKLLVAEGTEGVKVNAVIAVLAEDGEDASDIDEPQKSAASKPAETPKADDDPKTAPEPKATEASANDAKDHGKPEVTRPPAQRADGERIFATPLARRIAKQKGIDLTSISGSGPRGRIVKADVENAQPGAAPKSATGGQTVTRATGMS
ncbi:MAG: biotin/lipoyl-containing protein, partial [Pseudomonadota bacterium]